MEPDNMGSVALAISVLNALPALITASAQVLQLIETTRTTLATAQAEGRDPTDAEWKALHDTIAALQLQL